MMGTVNNQRLVLQIKPNAKSPANSPVLANSTTTTVANTVRIATLTPEQIDSIKTTDQLASKIEYTALAGWEAAPLNFDDTVISKGFYDNTSSAINYNSEHSFYRTSLAGLVNSTGGFESQKT